MIAGRRIPKNRKQAILRIVLVLVIQASFVAFPVIAFALSTVNLTLDEGNADEAGQVPGSFTLSRTDDGNLVQSLVVQIHITGTAIAGADYSLPFEMVGVGDDRYHVVINGNQLSQTVNLFPILDNLIEGSEDVLLTLEDLNSTYEIGTDTEAQITIEDDVVEVTMVLDDGDMAELGQDPGSFTLTRSNSGNIVSSIVIQLHITGTATAGADYPLPFEMVGIGNDNYHVVINGNQLSQTVTIVPILDMLIEGEEFISIQLQETGVEYIAPVQNTVHMTIADYVEVIFSDSFEDPDP